jgi:hypothetical protein
MHQKNAPIEKNILGQRSEHVALWKFAQLLMRFGENLHKSLAMLYYQ